MPVNGRVQVSSQPIGWGSLQDGDSAYYYTNNHDIIHLLKIDGQVYESPYTLAKPLGGGGGTVHELVSGIDFNDDGISSGNISWNGDDDTLIIEDGTNDRVKLGKITSTDYGLQVLQGGVTLGKFYGSTNELAGWTINTDTITKTVNTRTVQLSVTGTPSEPRLHVSSDGNNYIKVGILAANKVGLLAHSGGVDVLRVDDDGAKIGNWTMAGNTLTAGEILLDATDDAEQIRIGGASTNIRLDGLKNRVAITSGGADTVVMGYLEGLKAGKATGTITAKSETGDVTTIRDSTKTWATGTNFNTLSLYIDYDGAGAGAAVLVGPVTVTMTTEGNNGLQFADVDNEDHDLIVVDTSTYYVEYDSDDYGFWVKPSYNMFIDGDVVYDSGDWLIESDGSIKFKETAGSGYEVMRLGTVAGERGLFIANATHADIASATRTAKITDAGFLLGTGGVVGGVTNYLSYDSTSGVMELRGTLKLTDGTAVANMNWEGSWSTLPGFEATTYAVNDGVSYDGASYICILANTSTDDTNVNTGRPDTSNSNAWEILADQGAQGIQGITGDQGATGSIGFAARTISLNPSAHIITYDIEGDLDPDPQAINFTVISTGTVGVKTYQYEYSVNAGVSWVVGQAYSGTSTYTLADAQEPAVGASTLVRVTLKEDILGEGPSHAVAVAQDVVTVFAVQEGAEGITAYLTNAVHTVSSDSDGSNAVVTAVTGTFTLLVGGVNANVATGAATGYTITSTNPVDGVTASISNTADGTEGDYTFAGTWTDASTTVVFTFQAVIPAATAGTGANVTVTADFTMTKSIGLSDYTTQAVLDSTGMTIYNTDPEPLQLAKFGTEIEIGSSEEHRVLIDANSVQIYGGSIDRFCQITGGNLQFKSGDFVNNYSFIQYIPASILDFGEDFVFANVDGYNDYPDGMSYAVIYLPQVVKTYESSLSGADYGFGFYSEGILGATMPSEQGFKPVLKAFTGEVDPTVGSTGILSVTQSVGVWKGAWPTSRFPIHVRRDVHPPSCAIDIRHGVSDSYILYDWDNYQCPVSRWDGVSAQTANIGARIASSGNAIMVHSDYEPGEGHGLDSNYGGYSVNNTSQTNEQVKFRVKMYHTQTGQLLNCRFGMRIGSRNTLATGDADFSFIEDEVIFLSGLGYDGVPYGSSTSGGHYVDYVFNFADYGGVIPFTDSAGGGLYPMMAEVCPEGAWRQSDGVGADAVFRLQNLEYISLQAFTEQEGTGYADALLVSTQ